MPPTRDHYAILGVHPAAEFAAIRTAYLRLARENHPDVAGAESVARMQLINVAWETLRDSDRRAAYDRTLPRARFQREAPTPAAAQRARASTAPPRSSAPPPRPTTWRPVGVPWEEEFTDWYAYLDLPKECTEDEIRVALARRREHALPHRGTGWADRLLAYLARVESILLDPVKRQAFETEMERRHANQRRAWGAPPRPQGPLAGSDWYAILGVAPDASRAKIQSAMEARASELSAAGVTATEYARRRAELRQAWAILGNDAARAHYDRTRGS